MCNISFNRNHIAACIRLLSMRLHNASDKSEVLDLLITGVTVVHTKPELQVIENAVIGIRGSRIIFVTTVQNAYAKNAKRTIDLNGHMVLPGFINVHTHTILTMVRGVAEDMGFAPAYTPGVPHGHEVTPEEAVALARLGALEAMLFGSTTINDSYVHAELTLPAMADIGLRTYACGRIHDVDFSRVHLGEWRHDDKIGERTLAEALALHSKWHGSRDGRIGVHLTPHATDTCSKHLLRQVSDHCELHNSVVTTHLSQSVMENQRVQARDGCSPCELLEQVGLLGPRLIAAHGMYMSDSDIHRAGRAKMNLAHVPKGNATGGRIAPSRAMQNAGIRLTLATDNMHADMIEVMRWALNLGRIQVGCIDDSWQPADMLRMATFNGAHAMGLGDQIGTLEAGKLADLVCVDMNRPHLVPCINPLGNLVHTGQGSDVAMVIVHGEIVVENGRATRADQDTILINAQRAANALWQRARTQI
jgi:5-methylthioadenosine/S-adenosylhomocysteine deaminase